MLDIILHKYLRQSILLIAALFLLTLLYVRLWGTADVMAMPLAVCVIFQLLACGTYGVVWKRVAATSPQSLPTLYLAASGIRMMAALAVVVVYLIVVDNPVSVRFFVVTFLVFYLAVLAYDTAFFVKVEKTLKKNDK